jgi:signal recognition particle receptor subunit beta
MLLCLDILVLLNKQDIPSASPAQEIIDLVKQRTTVTERDHLFMVSNIRGIFVDINAFIFNSLQMQLKNVLV